MATIPPIHALTQAVVGDTQEVHLLLSGTETMHGYQLKPSQVRALRNAGLVVYVDGGLETFLKNERRPGDMRANLLPLAREAGMHLHKMRSGVRWPSHEHEEHAEHEVHEEAHHEGAVTDLHIWLNPYNAMIAVDAIARELAKLNPEHSAHYLRNATQVKAQLKELDARLTQALAPVQKQAYLVFHDAYQYFDQRYGLHGVGALMTDPEGALSAGRMRDIRHLIASEQVVCAFREPQFSDRALAAVTEGTQVRLGALDPLGMHIPPGPDHYVVMMETLAADMLACLMSAGQ